MVHVTDAAPGKLGQDDGKEVLIREGAPGACQRLRSCMSERAWCGQRKFYKIQLLHRPLEKCPER